MSKNTVQAAAATSLKTIDFVRVFALAQMIDGVGATRETLRSDIVEAFRDADDVLRRQVVDAADNELETNHAEDLVLTQVSQTDAYRALAASGREMEATQVACDAARQALWLGVALAYRVFTGAGSFADEKGRPDGGI